MNKPYTIIQCSNYFEYKSLKEKLVVSKSTSIEYMDSTYTFRIPALTSHEFESTIKQHAPTAKLTKKLTKNNKSTYIKLKD